MHRLYAPLDSDSIIFLIIVDRPLSHEHIIIIVRVLIELSFMLRC